MSLPKISLVTPSFNQAPYLEQTIRSVLDQGYPNLEYVIIDGGSTDGSADIIRRYAGQLKYWVSERDKGQTDALNKGLSHCTGDVFGYINSDDYLYPRSLARVAQAWTEGVRWMVGWSVYLEEGDGNWPYMRRETQRRVDWFLDNPIPQQSSFWARSLIDQVGPFRTDLHYCFDYEYWMRLRFVAGVSPVGIRQCLSAFRLHDASKTTTVWPKFEDEFRIIRAEYRKYLTPRDRLKWWAGRRQLAAKAAEQRMWRAIKERDAPTARREAWSLAGNRPLAVASWVGLAHALRSR
jgi:glycosyltransferase involved in cell wall biosynthesis